MEQSCDRARSLVSQGLDRPLRELEDRFVTSHLARCGACRAFAEDARAFTSLLRSAPLEPVPWPVTVRVPAPRRRVRVRALAQIASVASVVVVSGSIALGQGWPLEPSERSLDVARSADPALAEGTIRVLQREALARGLVHILPVAEPPSETAAAGVKPPLPVESR